MGNVISNVSHPQFDLGSGVIGGIDPSVGDWKLPAGNYVSTGMGMTIVHPRPEIETNTWARYRHEHTGVPYTIPVAVQGGAYPFHYELITFPSGMIIGEDLVASGDALIRPADYGIINWASPTAGSHTVKVRVTDQLNSIKEVEWTLTVGTAGWIFVNPLAADDTGTGAIDDPFKTVGRIHSDSASSTEFAGYRVYLRGGTIPLDGMATNGGNFRLDPNTNPLVWLGYPSETVVVEEYEGWMVIGTGTDDVYLGGFTFQYAAAYSPGGGTAPIYMINSIGGYDRMQVHGLTFKEFKGSPFNAGAGNTAAMYFNSNPRNYISITDCEATGTVGIFVDCYQWNYSVIDGFNVHDAAIITTDGSAHTTFLIKDNPDFVTLRNIEMWDNNTWNSSIGGVGYMCQNGGTNTEVSYCTVLNPITSGRNGAVYLFNNNIDGGLVENLWLYRNSLNQRLVWEGSAMTNFADGEEIHTKNILQTQSIAVADARVTDIDNIDSGTYLDASMKLTGASRVSYLGTHGAEVAG